MISKTKASDPGWLDRFVASPCSTPRLGIDEAFQFHADLGFGKFEAFSNWAASALDLYADPQAYRDKAGGYGLRISSFHLPAVNDDNGASLDRAVRACTFAVALGAPIVLFKADSIERYIASGRAFLDGIDHLPIQPVLQNHYGTPISTLQDFDRVLAGIGDDRMRTLFEVGHFHSAGVGWREGYAFLGDSISLVHIKDQVGRQSVPFGTGQIDLAALFRRLEDDGYRGDYVVEMEVADPENTQNYLRAARDYIDRHNPGDPQ